MTKRTGKTLIATETDASTAELIATGFTAEEAGTMLSFRRVLPYDTDGKTPKIDARKLWERIGKPWGKFATWADKFIIPELESNNSVITEIIRVLTPTARKPRVDYLLSRDLACELAMQARTPEGKTVRRYFLLMEKAAMLLPTRNQHRDMTEEDKALTHFLLVKTEFDKQQARELETDIKSRFARVLTGFTAGNWREAKGKGIRDCLSVADLAKYDRAWSFYVATITDGQTTRKKADEKLKKQIRWHIDGATYGLTEQF